MLSIATLGAGQEAYYLDAVARGLEDYYVGAGEAPGRWVDSAASEFDLTGNVGATICWRSCRVSTRRPGGEWRRVAAANR